MKYGNMKRVRCLENGQVYESEVQAGQELGVWASHVSHVCNGARKTTGGLHFEFAECADRLRVALKK